MSEFSGSGLSGLGNIDCRWPNRGLFVFYVLQNWNHNTLGLFRFGQVRSVHPCPPVPFCKIYIFVLFGLRMSSRRRLTGEREGNSNFSIQSERQRGATDRAVSWFQASLRKNTTAAIQPLGYVKAAIFKTFQPLYLSMSPLIMALWKVKISKWPKPPFLNQKMFCENWWH